MPKVDNEATEEDRGITSNTKKTWFPDDYSNQKDLWRAALAEFVAMFFFVFMGCGSVTATGEFLVANALNPVPASVARVMPIATAFGISIVVLAFAVGPISGGHINPAVTLAILLQRRISPRRAVLYWVAQFSGSCAGALMLWGGISNVSYAPVNGIEQLANFTLGTTVIPAVQRPPFLLGVNMLNAALNPGNGLILEIMGTSLLVFTVLSTAVDSRSLNQVQMLAPIPIGFSVWVAHLVLIPWTGCGINPARTFGPALINSFAGMNTWGNSWWIYYLGPAAGATGTSFIMWILWGGPNPPKGTMAVEDIDKV